MDEGICNSEISLNAIAKNMDFSANARRRPCLPHEKKTPRKVTKQRVSWLLPACDFVRVSICSPVFFKFSSWTCVIT